MISINNAFIKYWFPESVEERELVDTYRNITNANLTTGQKWASFGADVGYIGVKS